MNDERLKRPAAQARETREMADRAVTENREVTDAERVDMLRQSFYQSALPDLPKIPGWHTCWLTTNNPRDSIQMRTRLGYEPVKPEDVPGWSYVTLKTGEYVGLIGVNEMVAFKLPLSLYEMYMKEAHHDAPNREEEKLTDTEDQIRAQARAKGADIVVGEGNSALREKREAQFDLS